MTASGQHIKTIGIIGYGRLALHIAPALVESGIEINQWCVRNEKYHNEIVQTYKLNPVADPGGLNDSSDLLLLMISDTAIQDVGRQMPAVSSIVCHTSGMTPLSALPQERSGIFYPLNTFNGINPNWNEKTPILIHASNPDIVMDLVMLGSKISTAVQPISQDELQAIHLAAVISQNFSNHLIALAEALLESNDLDRSLIHPLLQSMIENLHARPARANQTGPAIRRDESTINRQLTFLENYPQLKDIYTLLTSSIQDEPID